MHYCFAVYFLYTFSKLSRSEWIEVLKNFCQGVELAFCTTKCSILQVQLALPILILFLILFHIYKSAKSSILIIGFFVLFCIFQKFAGQAGKMVH